MVPIASPPTVLEARPESGQRHACRPGLPRVTLGFYLSGRGFHLHHEHAILASHLQVTSRTLRPHLTHGGTPSGHWMVNPSV